jgi:hypothetical protein
MTIGIEFHGQEEEGNTNGDKNSRTLAELKFFKLPSLNIFPASK